MPLIFDEVVTGFRLAYGGAQEYYGVVPDLCTLGKVIGGGFPLAAIAGKAEIMAHFDKSKVGDENYLCADRHACRATRSPPRPGSRRWRS